MEVGRESQRMIEETMEKTKRVMDSQKEIQSEVRETKELSEEAN